MKNKLSAYLNFIPAFKKAFVLIQISFRQLTWREIFTDLGKISISIGFVIIPSFVMGFIFVLLPQGRDCLLLVVEQMSVGQFWSFAGLLTALVFWSINSELGVRYSIAISDNSGMNLSDERVKWRITAQKLFAAVFLLWPSVILIIGFLNAMASASYFPKNKFYLFYICIAAPIMIIMLLGYLYFHKFGKGVSGKPKRTLLGHRSLPVREQFWLNKLYGIYNEFIYLLPKSSSFRGGLKKELQTFNDNFLTASDEELCNFPQNPQNFFKGKQVPEDFAIVKGPKKSGSSGVFYKWIYNIPRAFYKGLHRQVVICLTMSLALIVGLAFIPGEWSFFFKYGAPGLVCLALGCYTGLYSGLLYIDKAVLKNWMIPLRVLLLGYIFLVSWKNNDHPVRTLSPTSTRVDVRDKFKSWFDGYRQHMDMQYPATKIKEYPVIFICAEGGAFRTGAYTALFLTKLEALLAKSDKKIDLRSSIFAMSGVSGGATGLGLYNAIAFRDKLPIQDTVNVASSRRFFLYDSLSPLLGKMLFGEFIGLFWPHHIEVFDRAIALEKSWEAAYSRVYEKHNNTFTQSFNKHADDPVLMINTTEIETGLQCWVTNYHITGNDLYTKRDLCEKKIPDMRYSTALNFSTRFPLFSPAGEINGTEGTERLHYVDGGYVENTGMQSMLDLLRILQTTNQFQYIKPIVISLRFGESSTKSKPIKFLNEFSEIINGLVNTRDGRTAVTTRDFEDYLRQCHQGIKLNEALSSTQKEVPMNWVMSQQSMQRILTDVNRELTSDSDLMQVFLRGDINFLKIN